MVKVKNRLDKRFYAVKKIRLDGREGALSNRLRREVGTGATHHSVVIFYFSLQTVCIHYLIHIYLL